MKEDPNSTNKPDLSRRKLIIGSAASAAGLAIGTASDPSARAQSDISATILITGASRGIGFEFSSQYAAKNWRVIATCRRPDKADLLQALAAENTNVTVEQLDVLDHEAIQELAEAYKETPIDVLLNNAGIMGDETHQSLGQFDFRSFQKVMDTNAVGPLKMAESFIDHVSASAQKKIMNVSSAGGSLSTARGGGRYFYRVSKTALNGFMRNLAVDVVDRGIIIGLLSPGRVLNDAMREAIRQANITLETIEPKVSIAGMIDVIDRFTPETSGAFIGHRGDTIPW